MADQESGSLPLGGGNKNRQPAPAGQQPQRQAAPPAAAAPAATGWYEVTKGGKIPVKGGVTNVPVGKQINSASYDVKKLQQAGIELSPIEPPAWYQALQGTAAVLLLVLSLAVGAAGCGGAPVAGGMPAGADLCALNPVASSCTSVESVQGAVFGPSSFVTDWTGQWGTYKCEAPFDSNTWTIGGRTHTTLVPNQTGLWQTRYEAVSTTAMINLGFGVTLSVAATMPLTNAMDGPYHVAYNSGPYTESVCMKTLWHSQCMLATVPAYGTWIYARGERSDYPGGVQVITIDPQQPDPANGACNKRLQFVLALI